MALTRIENNQISNAVAGNTEVGINGNLKLQEYTVTGSRLANSIVYGSDFTANGNITGGNIFTGGLVSATGNITGNYILGNITFANGFNSNTIFNGTSNVLIGAANGNITMSVNGTSNVVVVTSDTVQTNNISTTGNAIVGGDLVVNGNLVYVNVTDLNVEDPIIGLGRGANNAPLTTDDGKDRGEQLWYYAGSEKSAFTGYDNSAGKILLATDVTITNEIVTVNNLGNLVIGNLEGASSSVTGTATAGNVATAGTVSATGTGTFGNVATAGTVSATGTGTFGNLATGGTVSATGTATLGNVLTGGVVSAVGTATAGNVLTGGVVSATGTGTFGNVATAGTVSATGTATLGNVLTGGDVSAVGTVTGGNVATGGSVSASGNVTGGNLLFGSGIVSGTGNIYANNIFANISGNIDAAGSNTQVQFNNNDLLGASANFTFAPNTNTLTVSNGNIVGGNLITGGVISATSTIQGGNIVTAGDVSATGSLTGGNIFTGGAVSAVSTVTGGNIATAGTVSATGNITGNFFLGNGSQLTGIDTNLIKNGSSNVRILTANGNISMDVNATSNVVVVTDAGINVTGTVSASGNVTGQNLFTGGNVSATGDMLANNVRTDNVISTTELGIFTGSNGNILIQPNGSGNIILANTYINGLQLTPQQDADAASKYYVDQIATTAISYHDAVVVATNTTLATATGGTITYAQPNGVSNGVGATLTTTGSFNLIDSGNVQTAGTRILVKDEANATHNGVYVWSNATVITRASTEDTYGAANANTLSINDYFFVSGGNVNLGSAWIVDAPAGVITFGTSNIQFAQFSQAQIYSANTSAGLSLIGQTFSAKVDNNTTAFDGGGNISVKAGANLTTPNIGAATGTSLSLTGNIDAGNVYTGGAVSAASTITGGNIATGGTVSATGTINGGNVLTGGLISATGTITSASTITGGNILTGGVVSAVGNITGGNAFIGGIVSATSTITAGNVLTAGDVSAGGSLTGGNIFTGGVVSAVSTITGGNLATGGTVSASGTITGGNIATAGTVSATGNITGNYFLGNGAFMTGIDRNLIRFGDSNVRILSANGNISMDVNGTGNVVVVTTGGMSVTGNVQSTQYTLGANAVFGSSLTATTGATVAVNATDSILMPVGNTLQRPSGVTGMLRFNTTTDKLEVYDSNSWEQVGATVFTVIGDQQFAGDDSTLTFVLSDTQTTNSCIVSINGVVQIPGTAYSVTGTNLTFTEAPLAGDDIDVRKITTTTTVVAIQNSPANAAITVNDTSNVITVTGRLQGTGNVISIVGDLTVSGNATITGNVATNSISNGNSRVEIPTTNGNVNIDVGVTNNMAVFTPTDLIITGNVSVTGNVTAQDVNSLSDVTLKTNIQPISGIESVLFGLKGYEYDWKNGSGHSYGFLAQEVEKVLPNAVKTGADGLKAINYMMIIPFLVETIKQMGSEIKDLKQTVSGRGKKK
jgi:hypothetical protein